MEFVVAGFVTTTFVPKRETFDMWEIIKSLAKAYWVLVTTPIDSDDEACHW